MVGFNPTTFPLNQKTVGSNPTAFPLNRKTVGFNPTAFPLNRKTVGFNPTAFQLKERGYLFSGEAGGSALVASCFSGWPSGPTRRVRGLPRNGCRPNSVSFSEPLPPR